jgi:hypothetical protein
VLDAAGYSEPSVLAALGLPRFGELLANLSHDLGVELDTWCRAPSR